MAKPTGTIGPFRVRFNEDQTVTGEFLQVPFSQEKAAIEMDVTQKFISSANKVLSELGEARRFILFDPKQNLEDDFDFSFFTCNGPAYLELMEIAPQTGPYEQAPKKYNVYDYAETIWKGISKKSARYDTKDKETIIYLLLYVTHWSFILCDEVIDCLAYWSNCNPHVFKAIFLYQTSDNEEGESFSIFPTPDDAFVGFNPEKYRNNNFTHLDPRAWKIYGE